MSLVSGEIVTDVSTSSVLAFLCTCTPSISDFLLAAKTSVFNQRSIKKSEEAINTRTYLKIFFSHFEIYTKFFT
ncbi:hypothetical protein FKM82_008480 [Ascaphus truei]